METKLAIADPINKYAFEQAEPTQSKRQSRNTSASKTIIKQLSSEDNLISNNEYSDVYGDGREQLPKVPTNSHSRW